jgi:hypothetical protein
VQAALIAGALAGLVALSMPVAAIAAAAGTMVANLVVPPWSFEPIASNVAVAVFVAVAAGVGTSWVRMNRPNAQRAMRVAVVALIVGNLLLAVALAWGPAGIGEFLSNQPQANTKHTDGEFYLDVYYLMQQGRGYYEAFAEGYLRNARWASLPFSVLSVRPPTLIAVWVALPGAPASFAVLFLAVAALAVATAPMISAPRAGPAVSLLASVCVAAYVLSIAVSHTFTYQEAWAGLLLLLAFVAYSRALRSERRLSWMIAAGATCVLAFMVRELAAVGVIGGFAAAWLAPAEKRRAETLVWGAAAAICTAFWLAHAARAGQIVVARQTAELWFDWGGVDNLFASATWNSIGFGANRWVAFALAVMGAAGAAGLADRQHRLFALLVGTLPLVAFLFVGTNATLSGGELAGPWGGIVLPSLLALAPCTLAWLPGTTESELRR